MLTDDYWLNEFDVTRDDLERIARRMREQKQSLTLTEIAKRLVLGRLEHGADYSPAALPADADEASVCLWDPAEEWQIGDRVIVAQNRDGKLLTYVAEVISVDSESVTVRSDGKEGIAKFLCDQTGSEQAIAWRDNVRQQVERNKELLRQQRAEKEFRERVELVMQVYGDRVVRRLLTALQDDSRFVALEDRWFLVELLPLLNQEQLAALHTRMLQHCQPCQLGELLPWVQAPLPAGELGLLSIHHALQSAIAGHFENQGTPTRPLWKATLPPPPSWQQACGDCYVYDPDTYQIILQPGQRLTKTLAARLEAMNLYAQTIRPAE